MAVKRRVGRSETAPYRWKMVGFHFVPTHPTLLLLKGEKHEKCDFN